jgi:hypothetical protein
MYSYPATVLDLTNWLPAALSAPAAFGVAPSCGMQGRILLSSPYAGIWIHGLKNSNPKILMLWCWRLRV